ncbi:30S ribosomal protein S12 methylthiotransferase RimO [Helicovermis profundi]|uniref:Ribosomal protein uS12 methylthiotransferase RimO n=1 Tax=Helicovermis profundi TaxID=3065157 RepID=A0AAU9EIB4_9FIRM|nr:30S ribosomal protein S12 methylthiotransferase RimO [Clostridia bacterium S502]
MNLKIYFETLGCAKNQVDSEMMIGIMSKNNYNIELDPSKADIIVVNTCGFIGDAKEESINTIIELLEHKKNGICKVFVAAGCLVERYADELEKELPEVDAFIGTTKFVNIYYIIDEILSNKEINSKRITATGDIDDDIDENIPRILLSPNYYAFLKVSEGCDNLCTYCIIPKLRGKYRSRKMEDIVLEAKDLVSGGVKELIIIAQDTTRYGIDLYGKYKLSALLKELNKIEGLKWIRLQYCYPDVIDDELIDAIATLDKVVKYIDIPIQHASNSVLKRMNRNTSKEQLYSVINKLREKVSDIVIRTTLLVGFPGETDEEFNELKEFISDVKLDKVGVFAYSLEEDTAAAKMKNQVDEEIRENRKNELLAIQVQISSDNLNKFFGREIEVIVEEKVPKENVYLCRSSYDAPEVDGIVYVNTEKELETGEFISVKIIDSMEYDLIGEF